MLGSLPVPEGDSILVGFENAEDAAVYKIAEDRALVVTVDVITPLVDDPVLFGAIAATNALSDVYAMGGRALMSLSFIGTPAKFPMDITAEILRGGAEKAMAAGAPVLGGHSVQSQDLMYGLCAVGEVHPDQILKNDNLRAGDQLVLTKPLGTGGICTALKSGKLDMEHEAVVAAVAGMTLTNAAAVEPMRAAGVRAATDVTGFGLLGHAAEMAEASKVQVVFEQKSIPEYPMGRELLARGFVTRGETVNPRYVRELGPLDGEPESLLLDPQTSGGLLVAVVPEHLDGLLAALHAAGYPAATQIGEVRVGGGILVI